jgi:hypothetical protein
MYSCKMTRKRPVCPLVSQWKGASLTYDANGNLTSDGTHSYTRDARNRLKQIDLGNTASFTY